MLTSMTAARRMTMDDLFADGIDVRAELIEGVIMPKAEAGAEHGFAQGKLYAWTATSSTSSQRSTLQACRATG